MRREGGFVTIFRTLKSHTVSSSKLLFLVFWVFLGISHFGTSPRVVFVILFHEYRLITSLANYQVSFKHMTSEVSNRIEFFSFFVIDFKKSNGGFRGSSLHVISGIPWSVSRGD